MPLFRFEFPAMSCPNEILIETEDKSRAEDGFRIAVDEVRRIEQLWSRYRPDSVVSLINRAAGQQPVAVDAETASMLDYASAAWYQSEGAFDITSGVLRRAWKFSEHPLPTQAEIGPLLPLIGWDRVEWSSPSIRLPQVGMEIDFGGLGKEYAADRAATLLAQLGLAALVNLGGDIVATAPRAGESAWEIGIGDPSHRQELAARLPLFSGALATSGNAERCIVVDGKRYGHILDPRTGWPAPDAPDSVSVLAASCLVAGTLATIAMLNGTSAEDWLEGCGARYFVTRCQAISRR